MERLSILPKVTEIICEEDEFESSGSEVKASACNAGDLGSIPWRRKWQPTPVFLPGESGGAWCMGYSPRGRKESDTTSLSLSLSFKCKARL